MILLGIWVYLMVGCLIGRIAFVRILGDHPRYSRANAYGQYSTNYAFSRAAWTAVACIPFWPIAGPIALMFSHTGYEKAKIKRQKLEDQIKELKEEVAG